MKEKNKFKQTLQRLKEYARLKRQYAMKIRMAQSESDFYFYCRQFKKMEHYHAMQLHEIINRNLRPVNWPFYVGDYKK